MIYWIALPLAGIALAVFLTTLFRHWKEIRLLDPDSIKEERVRRKREEIINQRFDRVRSGAVAPLQKVMKHSVTAAKKTFHGAYIKLVHLDRFYKQAKAPFASIAPSMKDKIRTLLDEARSLARDLKWADAERRYLEVLGMDDRNLDAYKGLASIYLKQKLYPQARETFEFLMKTKQADASCYAGMGEIYEAEGDLVKAEEMFLKALEMQPRSPHRHSQLAEYYLDLNEPEKAVTLLQRAVELEPKSAKYLEQAIDASVRLGNRVEARRYYDKFRLVSEDRPKLQALKDRIEELSG
ncbi:MAG: tetratricopeptide repeat protein [Patescibacteria group bacterium]|jgi:Flp pilus assembly protein TadD